LLLPHATPSLRAFGLLKGGLMSNGSYGEWVTGGPFSPYLLERQLVGSAPVNLLEMATPAGEFFAPPVDDLVLILDRAIYRAKADLGAGRFAVRGEPGNLYLVAPNTATTMTAETPHAVGAVAVPSPFLRPFLEERRGAAEPFDFGRLHTGAFRNATVTAMAERMWRAAAMGEAAGRLFADSAAIVLANELVAEADGRARVQTGGLSPQQLRRAVEFIGANVKDDLGLAEVAGVVGLSPWHFARAFKESTGVPPHRWLIQRRLELAQDLLARTDLRITEIAAAVGYDDPNQLARIFRRYVGTSPGAWRRAARK
jgi:AraC family transcriptional regulator